MNTEKKNSGKTAYLIIITIITVCCILAGVLINVGGFFGRKTGSGLFNRGFHIGWGDAGEMVRETVSLEDFDSIDINLNLGEVRIVEGSKAEVHYEFPEKYVPTIDVDGGKLKVRQSEKVSANNTAKDDFSLVLTVPEGKDFEEVRVNCSLGDIDIVGIDGGKLDVDESLGSVEIRDGNFESMDLDNSLGDIRVSGVTSKSITANLSMGDLRVEDSDIDDVKCDNSMGSIKFEGKFKYVDIDNSMGDINLETGSDWKGALTTDMGSVKVNGEDMGTKCKR